MRQEWQHDKCLSGHNPSPEGYALNKWDFLLPS